MPCYMRLQRRPFHHYLEPIGSLAARHVQAPRVAHAEQDIESNLPFRLIAQQEGWTASPISLLDHSFQAPSVNAVYFCSPHGCGAGQHYKGRHLKSAMIKISAAGSSPSWRWPGGKQHVRTQYGLVKTKAVTGTAMCYNIIDGRFHQSCCHFKAMSTRRHDCMRHICFFSYRHPANCTSKTCRCKRTMDQPILNPIRLSPTRCPDCVQIERLKTESELVSRPESELESRLESKS